MKRLFFAMFLLFSGFVRADVPSLLPVLNAPEVPFLDLSSVSYESGGGLFVASSVPGYSPFANDLIFWRFSSYSDALAAFDALQSSGLWFVGLPEYCPALVPLRSGTSDVISWGVVPCGPNSGEYQDDAESFLRSRGFSVPPWEVFTFIGPVAEYGEPEEPEEPEEPQDPEEPEEPIASAPDCVYTVVDGQILYVFPESSFPSGAYAEVVRGPALYATTKEAAEACADGFGAFLVNYDWPWVGVPAVMPWTSPKVYKCIERFNGQNVGVFYRIVFQNYLGTGNDAYDTAYGQCLNDYAQVCGCGGLNLVQFVKPSAVLNDTVTGVSELNGRSLASGSVGASAPLSSLPSDVSFVQYTTQKVSSEDDVTGESVVSSTASASDDGATINITNNTEVNTNLELGDAPAVDSYSGDEAEEKTVSDSDSLLDKEETRYSYIDSSSTEKRIDWQKLWDDVKEKFDDMFGTDAILELFSSSGASNSLQPWTVNFVPISLFSAQSWSFVIDWPTIAASSIVQMFRTVFSFFLGYETIIMCLRLFS